MASEAPSIPQENGVSVTNSTTPQSLYSFALPQHLLDTLIPRPDTFFTNPDPTPSIDEHRNKDPSASTEDQNATAPGLGCALCLHPTFNSTADQREHFKTDWHRYNVKMKLAGKWDESKVTRDERQWDELVEDLNDKDSLSGSDTSSEASTSGSTQSLDAVGRLFRKQVVANGGPLRGVTTGGDAGDDDDDSIANPRTGPLIWFTLPEDSARFESKDGPSPQTHYGIYRTIFPDSFHQRPSSVSTSTDWLSELRSLQVIPDLSLLSKKDRLGYRTGGENGTGTAKGGRTWTMLLFGGGHFAGMVVSLVPRLSSKGTGKGKEKFVEREVVVLAHKTFHRYTTRRKQGGSQATNDNAKGNAKSAGAGLRRYNEQALTEDVRNTLESWSEMISGSELVFLRASKTNYKTFFGYEGAILDVKKEEGRVRGLPFQTKRPTLSELTRCFLELTRVQVSHLTTEALASLASEAQAREKAVADRKAALVASKVKKERDRDEREKSKVKPSLSAEEVAERDRWERVVDMVRRGKLETLVGFVEKYQGVGGDDGRRDYLGKLPEWMDERDKSPTLLHLASSSDQSDIVKWLLHDRRVDPTLRSLVSPEREEGEAGLPPRTAYEVSASRTTRNVFRRCMADHPDWWDWAGSESGARVPSGLTEEMELAQGAKKQERRVGMKERMREREREREEVAAREAAAEEERMRKEAEAEAEERKRTEGSGKSGPQRLGGSDSGSRRDAGARSRAQEEVGLAAEQRARIERERRVRAIEARMKGGGGS